MSDTVRELRLPADLCAAAEQKFSARFANLEALLVFLLREVLRDDAAALDQNEQRIVEERLKDLGYI
jgi:hypothetical protein